VHEADYFVPSDEDRGHIAELGVYFAALDDISQLEERAAQDLS
jgi:hypothetical protein